MGCICCYPFSFFDPRPRSRWSLHLEHASARESIAALLSVLGHHKDHTTFFSSLTTGSTGS